MNAIKSIYVTMAINGVSDRIFDRMQSGDELKHKNPSEIAGDLKCLAEMYCHKANDNERIEHLKKMSVEAIRCMASIRSEIEGAL